jgi:hypothetical protein
MTRKVYALLSDYNGTLCLTSHVKDAFEDDNEEKPHDIGAALGRISQLIPVCIISSKDFNFRHTRPRRFASIKSCVLGIETINHIKHKDETFLDCIIEHHYIEGRPRLIDYSKILNKLLRQEKIQRYSRSISIKPKFTSDGRILIGITFDYRHLDNWAA